MAQDTEHVLSQRWKRLWGGHPRASDTYLSLTKCYVDNALPYHDLELLAEHLALLDTISVLARDVRSLELALWYHRCVCDASRSDNEAASAAFAAQELTKLGMSGYERARVMRLILAVRFGVPPQSEDEALMIDIIRGVLGGEPEKYASYSARIRDEFPFLTDDEYALARINALDEIVRGGVFHTPHFRAKYGAQALRNIASEKTLLLSYR